MELNKKDRRSIRIIIEKYEADVEVYTYLIRLMKKILKEKADK